jgi:hypothetical protein
MFLIFLKISGYLPVPILPEPSSFFKKIKNEAGANEKV